MKYEKYVLLINVYWGMVMGNWMVPLSALTLKMPSGVCRIVGLI